MSIADRVQAHQQVLEAEERLPQTTIAADQQQRAYDEAKARGDAVAARRADAAAWDQHVARVEEAARLHRARSDGARRMVERHIEAAWPTSPFNPASPTYHVFEEPERITAASVERVKAIRAVRFAPEDPETFQEC